ncbi:MAG: EAL domain-containing protein [Egibacteraceae bacterium]
MGVTAPRTPRHLRALRDASARWEVPAEGAGAPPSLRLPGPLLFVAVGVAYLALSQYAHWLNDPSRLDLGRGFWPAVGLATAALLLSPPRRWGWVIAAVGVAELGGDLANGYPLDATLLFVAACCLTPLVGAGLVRRFVHPRGALVPMRNLIGFLVLGVVVGPLAGGVFATIGTVALTGEPWSQGGPQSSAGLALGVLVVAPVLLTWRERHPDRHPLETGAFVAALGLVSVSPLALSHLSGSGWDIALPMAVAPLVLWAAFRYGVRGGAWMALWLTQRAALTTAAGYGPFVAVGAATGDSVSLLQAFFAFGPLSSLLIAALVADLGGRDSIESRLQRQAHHDALTGLPNRVALSVRLEQVLDRSQQPATGVVLLVCDLDGFKVINDGLGHQAGDEVLVEVARRLQAGVRPSDVVARLGGDEFVILAESADPQTVTALTDRILRIVAEPITLEAGQQVSLGVSIGVATAAPHHDAHTLLRDGDVALYRAKDRGRGRAEHFDEELRVQALERLSLPQELRVGLERGELFCLYQPEIEIGTGKLFGFEALVRWHHPTRGLLPPDRFIPLTEVAGLAGALFTYVLDQSLQAQQRWATNLGFHPAVCVNLSPRQLYDPSLPEHVATALTRTGVPADLLWLEVTEVAMVDDAAYATLDALHDLGVHLAIDDFGTGWSSMGRLSESPWDLLKIDRTFIAKLTVDPRAEHLVRAMISMAHALGIRTVAEGVETAEQLQIVTAMGCDIAQGYLFARPLASLRAIRDLAADGTWRGAVSADAPDRD